MIGTRLRDVLYPIPLLSVFIIAEVCTMATFLAWLLTESLR